jgi:hypothetical protein
VILPFGRIHWITASRRFDGLFDVLTQFLLVLYLCLNTFLYDRIVSFPLVSQGNSLVYGKSRCSFSKTAITVPFAACPIFSASRKKRVVVLYGVIALYWQLYTFFFFKLLTDRTLIWPLHKFLTTLCLTSSALTRLAHLLASFNMFIGSLTARLFLRDFLNF